MKDLNAAGREPLAVALVDLLHGRSAMALTAGRGDTEERAVPAWISALKPALSNLRPAWRTATAPRALLQPAEHVVVDPSKLALQARLLGRSLPPAPEPDLAHYRACRDLLLRVEQHLRLHDLAPADLLDVLDFVCVTLAPGPGSFCRARRAARRWCDARAPDHPRRRRRLPPGGPTVPGPRARLPGLRRGR